MRFPLKCLIYETLVYELAWPTLILNKWKAGVCGGLDYVMYVVDASMQCQQITHLLLESSICHVNYTWLQVFKCKYHIKQGKVLTYNNSVTNWCIKYSMGHYNSLQLNELKMWSFFYILTMTTCITRNRTPDLSDLASNALPTLPAASLKNTFFKQLRNVNQSRYEQIPPLHCLNLTWLT